MGLIKTRDHQADRLADLTDQQLGQLHHYVGTALWVIDRRIYKSDGHHPQSIVDAHGAGGDTIFRMLELTRKFYDDVSALTGNRPVKYVDNNGKSWSRQSGETGHVTLVPPTAKVPEPPPVSPPEVKS